MEGPVVKSRAITCPNCGAGVQIRGFGHTLNVVCDKCASVLNPNTPTITILQRVKAKQRITPKIPMGSKGTFENVPFEAIGFQQRGIVVEGVTYTWDEYLLFHPYKGFRYISEYNGHWSFIKPLPSLPDVAGRDATVGGHKYKHFQNAEAKTMYVVGEFPWQVRVGDKAVVDDYVDPPRILSAERTANEVNWSVGDYIPGKDIWKAFQLQGNPPDASGVYANQPNPRGGSLWRMYMLFFLLITFVSMYSCIAKRQREVFHDRYQFVPNSTAEPSFVTKVFDLPGGRKAATEVEIRADVSNNWVAFAVALINEQTGEAFDFGKDVSYYSGVDGGESWQEGSSKAIVTIPEVPPGRYYLRIEPDRDQEPGEPVERFARTINYEIIVRHDIPAVGMYFLILILLTIPPIWVGFRRWMFEQSRWSESDYAPVTSTE